MIGLFRNSLEDRIEALTPSLLKEKDTTKIHQQVLKTLTQRGDIENVFLYILDDKTKNFKYMHGQTQGKQLAEPPVPELEGGSHFCEYVQSTYRFLLKVSPPYFSEREQQAQEAIAALNVDLCIPLAVATRVFGLLLMTVKGVWDSDRAQKVQRVLTPYAIASARFHLKQTMEENEELVRERAILENLISLAIEMNHQINDPVGVITMKTEHFTRKLKRNMFHDDSQMKKSLQKLIQSNIVHCTRIQRAASRFREEMAAACEAIKGSRS